MRRTVAATLRPDLRRLADALWEAEETGTPICQPSTTTHVGLTLTEAYCVQRANIERRLARGERKVGHKIGLTSQAMRDALGVDEPDFGVFTNAHVVPDGGYVNPGTLLAPSLEAEYAFRIGADLPPNPPIEELRAAINDVGVAIELIDSRVRDWKIALVDTVADNASTAGMVIGPLRPATPELLERVRATTLSLTRDGEVVADGPGSAVLGDPVTALHWLARAIGGYGESLAAGDIVLTGAVAAAVPLTPDVSWEATADGFAPVALRS